MAATSTDRPPTINEVAAARRAENADRDAAAGRRPRRVEASMLPGIIAVVIAVASAIAVWMIS